MSLKPGVNYFYRIVSVDRVGNKSKPVQIGPLSLPVFIEQKLPDIIVSNITRGRYFINGTCTVPFGTKVQIGPDVDIAFKNNSLLKIQGELIVKSSFIHSDNTNGTKDILIDETGTMNISNLHIQGISKIYVKGNITAENISVIRQKTGLIIETINSARISNSTFKELQRAVWVKDGKVIISNCDFERNKLSLKIDRGDVDIKFNNFIDNDVNIDSQVPIKISSNYLGTTEPANFRVNGNVEVVSFFIRSIPRRKRDKPETSSRKI